MLVLTRKPTEEIVIEGNIRITVLGIVGNRVRIGVTAPESIRVHRQELLIRLELEAAGPETLAPSVGS